MCTSHGRYGGLAPWRGADTATQDGQVWMIDCSSIISVVVLAERGSNQREKRRGTRSASVFGGRLLEQGHQEERREVAHGGHLVKSGTQLIA
uniref:Uncharacterized protein n=1 Tax=Arundo donax TaxID=35708 RepID=A0A0A9FY21_ARUDO